MEDILKDLANFDLPKDDKMFDKIKCSLKHGSRIYWYYQEDLDFYKKLESDVREQKCFSGLCVIAPDREIRNIDQELECDECVIIVDDYPTEKCYPESEWIAINRLIDNDSLIEIYELN